MDVRDVRSLDEEATLQADVCIVGAGPAGLTIARELGGTGVRVLVLESGGSARDSEAERLNAIENVGAPRVADQSIARNRGLGGSSATWWGRLAAFDEIDLAPRDWVPHSGWPLTREEIAPYLTRSLDHLGGGVADNNAADVLGTVASWLPDLDPAGLRPYAWTYSRDSADPRDAMRFGPRALAEPMPGVQCLTSATVTAIDPTPAGDAVDRLEVRGPDGRRRWVRARHVVLCAGGIENARLLLASNRVVPAGVGNEHGLVGRFLMDHPRGPVGWYRPRDFLRVQRLLGARRLDTGGQVSRVVPGVAAGPELQARERLLNCAFWIEGAVSPYDPLLAVQELAARRWPVRNLASVLRRPGLLAENVVRRLGDRESVRVMSAVSLWAIVEQRPDPDSRITLSGRTDALGVPLPVVDWRIGPEEARTVRVAARRFAAEMARLRLPVPELLPMVTGDEVPFWLPDALHPTGATRMSRDPRDGVVDPHCAVHGVRGLHVAGSSVFPTSGHANPTQMIVALAVRLADRLAELLATRSDAAA